MDELKKHYKNLPTTIEELSSFVEIGKAKYITSLKVMDIVKTDEERKRLLRLTADNLIKTWIAHARLGELFGESEKGGRGKTVESVPQYSRDDRRFARAMYKSLQKRFMGKWIIKLEEEIKKIPQYYQPYNELRSWEKEQERNKRKSESANHGNIDIRCGDVIEEMEKIDNESIDLLPIDPPYNIGKAEWDNIDQYNEWSKVWLNECWRVLKKTGSIYIFGKFQVLKDTAIILESIGFKYRAYIVWDIMHGQGAALWIDRHEDILFYTKEDKYFNDKESVKILRHESNIRLQEGIELKFKNPSNVWRFSRVDPQDKERVAHPTQKPVAIIQRIITASCPGNGYYQEGLAILSSLIPEKLCNFAL